MPNSNKRYVWAVLISLILLCLSLIITIHISNYGEVSRTKLSTTTYALFFLSVAVIYALSFCLWRYFYSLFGFHRNRKDAFLDMGLMAIGKYMPGKIWGILFRGSLDNGLFRMDKSRVLVSFLEQGFSLSIGMTLVAVLLLTKQLDNPAIAFAVTIITTLALGTVILPAINFCLGNIKRIDTTLVIPTVLNRVKMGGGYVLLWIASAVPILILMQSTLVLSSSDTLSLIAVFLASMIAGWLAVLAPGGIGVRESVFVLLAPAFLSWQESLYWIALHRSLYTLFDIFYGILALGLIATRARTEAAR